MAGTDLHLISGMRVEYLPPYSPDYNPIELAFSLIKAEIRRQGDFARNDWANGSDADIRIRLIDTVFSVTEEHARAFYKHCGYVLEDDSV